jgi:hypothetical protein
MSRFMLDTEEKQILDKTRQNEDLQELREQRDIDGYLGPLEQKFIDDFLAVTSSMEKAMRHVPDLHFSKELDSPEYYALKSLYTAKTGRDIETGEYISGMARQRLLNQALIYLQPVLSLGLRPDFKEGRGIYDKLVVQVNEVTEEIKTAINKEAVAPSGRVRGDRKEQEDTDGDGDAAGDDGDAAGDDDGDAAGDDDADGTDEQASGDRSPDSEAEPDAGTKGKPARSIWSRLTGKKTPENDPEG